MLHEVETLKQRFVGTRYFKCAAELTEVMKILLQQNGNGADHC
ncbi:hypothetical protein PPTG_21058 [Phytophthora nicotianae INRA-310]|uniref:Uncharacterized protein n=1 Tax=Phytophthora nicotianae (strain INRA-310) TaxID=761204 RepID=W2R9H7_PHYN3|nr:hypothetical protein PPTG_21058 [Phytophthora nicotianae INRA-310]ETN21190.1 hypothetical protein PPTG_21058 [Phytophthora nicotianae INRA-310]